MAIDEIVQTVSVLIAASAVVVGVISWISSKRGEERQRKTQIFLDLYKTYQSRTFRRNISRMMIDWEWKDFEEFRERYLGSFENAAPANGTYAFFEGIGVLLKKNLIDKKLVNELVGNTTLWFWSKYEPIVKGSREQAKELFQTKRPWWLGFEYLANEMKKIQEAEAVEHQQACTHLDLFSRFT